ncbi:hypothetical protein C8R43DRAFT_525590 [Mycena crocata]|nr:hypothetical protein C8R43DRAFT_525590 [Mycena crocata]
MHDTDPLQGALKAPPPYVSDIHPQSEATVGRRAASGANSEERATDSSTAGTPGKGPDRKSESTKDLDFYGCMVIMLFVSMVIMGVRFISNSAGNRTVQNRIRQEWDTEVRGHEEIRRAWTSEVAAQQAVRVGWENERQELIDMRRQLVLDREKWAQECQESKHEEERQRREKNDRVRAGFAWDDLKAEQHCLRHGTRLYSARLTNVPREYNPIQACTETAIEIHGSKLPKPVRCEDRGCSGVYGHWTVDFSEPTCITYFNNFENKGCTSVGSGRRRIESRLENLRLENLHDWRDMCSTTPADFRKLHFDGPEICEHRGIYGVWGSWQIEDGACK